jgi:outer membrane protein TolC
MKRKFPALIVAMALAAAVPAASEKRPLTLDECVALGLANSKGLHASGAAVEASAAKAKEAGSALLPALKLGAGYTRLSEVPPFEVHLPFPAGLPFPMPEKFVVSPNYFNNFTLRLGLQQPLYTGGRLRAGVAAAKSGADAAELDLMRDRAELIFALRVAYWNLYKAREFVKAIDENVARTEAHLADVKNFFDQGLLTWNEVLRAEVQLSNVRLARLDAADAAEMAGIRLDSLLGLPLDTELEPATKIEDAAAFEDPDAAGMAGEEGDAPGLLEKVLVRRPEPRAMDLRVKAGEAGVAMARSGWYPQVYLAGNYYNLRPNPRLLPAKDEFYSTWDISLNISMDLWNWGATARQTEQAKARLVQAQDALGMIKDAVALELRQCQLELAGARAKIAVAREAVDQAEENLRIARERFREGVALNADVLDAEVLALQAKTNLTQTLVDAELARARLRKALGE